MVAQLKPTPRYLRPLIAADLVALMQGETASYSHPWTRRNFEDCLANRAYLCWVFERDEALCGHVICSIVLKEAHLLNICVYPHYQNQGWGRKLLHETEARLVQNGAETCFLEVRPSNHAGLQLYQSEGYNEIGLRKNYYPAQNGREHAIVMAKSLVIQHL